jgi:hypothetical protein
MHAMAEGARHSRSPREHAQRHGGPIAVHRIQWLHFSPRAQILPSSERRMHHQATKKSIAFSAAAISDFGSGAKASASRSEGGGADARSSPREGRTGAARFRWRSSVSSRHHFSPNGRVSTSNDHADFFCSVTDHTTSAMSSGDMKKSAGLSGIIFLVFSSAITPSTMMTDT